MHIKGQKVCFIMLLLTFMDNYKWTRDDVTIGSEQYKLRRMLFYLVLKYSVTLKLQKRVI